MALLMRADRDRLQIFDLLELRDHAGAGIARRDVAADAANAAILEGAHQMLDRETVEGTIAIDIDDDVAGRHAPGKVDPARLAAPQVGGQYPVGQAALYQ
jgi:hypothetical protein